MEIWQIIAKKKKKKCYFSVWIAQYEIALLFDNMFTDYTGDIVFA